LFQLLVCHFSPSEAGPAEISPAEVGPSEIGPVEVDPSEISHADVGPSEIGSIEIGSSEVKRAKIDPAKVGIPEIRTSIWILISPFVPLPEVPPFENTKKFLVGHEISPFSPFLCWFSFLLNSMPHQPIFTCHLLTSFTSTKPEDKRAA
jgi:hypothetical protein